MIKRNYSKESLNIINNIKEINKNNLIINTSIIKTLKINNKKLWWLVGFTDGDGYFIASINKKYKAINYRIGYHIHLEDLICLQNIIKILNIKLPINKRSNLNLINIDIQKQDHVKIIINIFNNYPLITIKYYGFLKWKDQFNNYINKTKLWDWFIENKYTINNYIPCTNKEGLNIPIPYDKINVSWLIGFIEASTSGGERRLFIN